MADQQIGNVHGVAAINIGGSNNKTNINGSGNADNLNNGDTPSAGFLSADLGAIDNMRTRLAAINGAYYTADRLNQMTYNDMVYAIRSVDYPYTIKQ